MADQGSGSSDHLDPSAKPVVGAVATPLSPWKTASPNPLNPGSSPEAAPASVDRTPPAIPDHELLRCIGRGSYGEVWLARDVLGQYRAVKVIHRSRFDSDHAYEREFEGLKRYEPVSRGDPSQVAVLHVGRHDDAGLYYYVMELADDANAECGMRNVEPFTGVPASTPRSALCTPHSYTPRTLKSELVQRKRLPLEECVEIGLALTTALEHLHGHGLIHRDIKPSNVIFINGVPKLADIGLVAAMDATMSFVGTAGYVPPEGPGKPTGDIYSLGKVLYQISVGRDTSEFPELPTAWESFAEQKQQLEFNAVVLRACALDPGQRYRTAREMHEDLVLLQQGKSIRHRRRVQRRWAVGRRVALTTLGILGLLLATYVLYRTFLGPREMVPASADHPVAVPLRASVFVLPFRNEGTNRVPDGVRGRITDAFIDSLALIKGVRRSPRKSGWVHQDEDTLRRSLAETNDMQHILTGRISGSGATLTITLRLHARGEDQPLWTESYSGTTNEVIALERCALVKIASLLEFKITEREQQEVDQLLTNNLEALEWYWKGSAYARSFSDARLTLAKDAYYRAAALDPNYCEAHAGVIYVNRVWFWNRSSNESWPDVLDRARMILKIDDTHYMARYWLAASKSDYDWDWEAATREWVGFLQKPPVNHTSLALCYRVLGRMDKARFHQAKIDAQLPATGPELRCSFTGKYVEALYDEMVQGGRGNGEDPRFDEVIAGGRRIQQLDPENHVGYQIEVMGHLGKHDYPAVIDATRRGRLLYEIQDLHALAGYAYARMGDKQRANDILRELERLPYQQPYFIARIHAALGNREQALTWLEKACEDRSEFLVKPDFGYGALRLDEAWDNLRSEPRFLELLRKTGLDKWPK